MENAGLKPDANQVKLGHQILEAGATAVIGAHPPVLQLWESYRRKNGREGLIIYSLGNFVRGQDSLPRRTSVLMYLGLTEDE